MCFHYPIPGYWIGTIEGSSCWDNELGLKVDAETSVALTGAEDPNIRLVKVDGLASSRVVVNSNRNDFG
ncbi:MAG: hypothetical protein GDA56_17955 [Hormoscilla sp. GM7CHS1pb]|nr:hypothetical protein [Hormoscilla sp. GM7CHS1pb]